MKQTLTLYRLGWCAFRLSNDMWTIRYPVVPEMLAFWCTGSGECPDGRPYDTYVGLVAVPDGVDPMTVVQQEFPGAWSRDMTRLYDPVNDVSGRFPTSGGDWHTQRLTYLLATGELYTKPVVGHYECGPSGETWWCTTNFEFFDL